MVMAVITKTKEAMKERDFEYYQQVQVQNFFRPCNLVHHGTRRVRRGVCNGL